MYGVLVGRLPTLGNGLFPPTSLDTTSFVSVREPDWLLGTEETKGPEADAGHPSVDEKPIPVFGISFGYRSSSDKGHSHRNFGQLAAAGRGFGGGRRC